jgi:hypothetical protein
MRKLGQVIVSGKNTGNLAFLYTEFDLAEIVRLALGKN